MGKENKKRAKELGAQEEDTKPTKRNRLEEEGADDEEALSAAKKMRKEKRRAERELREKNEEATTAKDEMEINDTTGMVVVEKIKIKKKKEKHEKVDESDKENADARKFMAGKKKKTEKKERPKGAVGLDEIPKLSEKSKELLRERGFDCLFEIQVKSFSPIFEGKDTVGKAKTGCGKTLAFVLPVVEKIIQEKMSSHKPRRSPLCVVVAPTRELAKQIFNEFELNCKSRDLKAACFYGGTMFGPQCQTIREGLDVMVCTPGRMLDHIRRETVDLSKVKFAILDEADEMLAMGFKDDVEEILGSMTGEKVQKLFFSATLPDWLNQLIEKHMDNATWIDVTSGENHTNTNITHQCIACMPFARADTLGDLIKVHAGAIYGKTIVFCDSKKEVGELCQHSKLVGLGAGMLHGDIPQEAREVTMENFRTGKIKCLVATDVASRGLDIPSVDLVVNTRPPTDVDMYVHRSGRTARAGKTGTCITFYGQKEEYVIRILRSKLGVPITRVGPPLPADIVRSAGKDAVKLIDNIPTENIEYFLDSAKTLIEDRGAEYCLAAALAAMTGYHTRVESRSLLCGMENFVTIIMSTKIEMWSSGKGWNLLRDRSWEISQEARGMQLLVDKSKCAFDVPASMVKQLLAAETWDGVTFEVATGLPEIGEKESCINADWKALSSRRQEFRERIMGKKNTEKSGKGKGGGKGKGKGKGGK